MRIRKFLIFYFFSFHLLLVFYPLEFRTFNSFEFRITISELFVFKLFQSWNCLLGLLHSSLNFFFEIIIVRQLTRTSLISGHF